MSRAITPAEVLEALGGDPEGLKAIGSAVLRVSKALTSNTIPELSNLSLATGAKVDNLPAFAQGTLRNLSRQLAELREIDNIIANQGTTEPMRGAAAESAALSTPGRSTIALHPKKD